ncbi:phosphate acetyltransferase [Stratiformator vulcanicus]|uniref:Phosphate acetyltransferase n=1 Tax=Stratiformator vulcanicus TaxID=2527980 RepID=A0A517QZF8_9PLAN|nr:phosphate acetyltransferase [Stratiformator vulcanicus]QDT36983.1 Phosphate acetyltransferase [Stratiformator vulcanicus]
MAESVYVATSESRTGKSMVALGVMEVASRHTNRLAFFRPIVSSTPEADQSLTLMRTRYQLPHDPQRLYGMNREQARELLAADRVDELIKIVLQKYQSLKAESDFVVLEGTSFHGLAPAYEFDLNASLAANLGCNVLPVLSARDKRDSDVSDALLIVLDQLADRNCEVVAAIVNHASPERLDRLQARLSNISPDGIPVYLVPGDPVLDKPTLGEIAVAIEAELLFGDPSGLDREVRKYVVAAMQVPHFLERLKEGNLVITPGDRSDILLAAITSVLSSNSQTIAGVVLTGGLVPEPAVKAVIAGLAPVPILAVKTDTFTTAMDVNSVPAVLRPENERKIASALGLFEQYVDATVLEQRLTSVKTSRVTPLMFEYELIRRAQADVKRIVLPEGTEPRILKAAEILHRRRVVDVTLLGNIDVIRREATAIGIDSDQFELIDPEHSDLLEEFGATYFELRKHKGMTEDAARDRMRDLSYFGTMMVHLGKADGMVSGAVHTTQHTIRPSFEFIKTSPGVSLVSSVFFMCLSDRVLVYGDCAVNPDPTAEELAEIAISSAVTAESFGIEPRVALLSYSTGESGKGADVDKVRKATELARGQRPDLKLEGPIQYDAAVEPSVARTKLPGSEVAGQASVLIFPDLNTGNNTYKAVQRSSGAVAVGPVLQGLRKPVNDLSRGCTVPDIVNTVAITAIQAQMGE